MQVQSCSSLDIHFQKRFGNRFGHLEVISRDSSIQFKLCGQLSYDGNATNSLFNLRNFPPPKKHTLSLIFFVKF